MSEDKMLQAIKDNIGIAITYDDDSHWYYIYVYDLSKNEGENIIKTTSYSRRDTEICANILEEYNFSQDDLKEINKSDSVFHHEYGYMLIYQARIKSNDNILRLEVHYRKAQMHVINCVSGEVIKTYEAADSMVLYKIAASGYDVNSDELEFIDRARVRWF